VPVQVVAPIKRPPHIKEHKHHKHQHFDAANIPRPPQSPPASASLSATSTSPIAPPTSSPASSSTAATVAASMAVSDAAAATTVLSSLSSFAPQSGSSTGMSALPDAASPQLSSSVGSSSNALSRAGGDTSQPLSELTHSAPSAAFNASSVSAPPEAGSTAAASPPSSVSIDGAPSCPPCPTSADCAHRPPHRHPRLHRQRDNVAVAEEAFTLSLGFIAAKAALLATDNVSTLLRHRLSHLHPTHSRPARLSHSACPCTVFFPVRSCLSTVAARVWSTWPSSAPFSLRC